MLSLLPLMIEKVGLIIIIAFFISNTKIFNNILKENSVKEKTALIVLFSIFSIISNVTGIEIVESRIIHTGWHVQVAQHGALANTRIMAVGIGGLLGGPVVGLCVGLAAGISRMSMGGFTAIECSVSSIIAGTISGFVGNYLRKKGCPITPVFTMFLGVGLEFMQMGIILLFAQPFEVALGLVKVIALPMSVINAVGSFIFLSIILLSQEREELVKASQTKRALFIADQTLPYFKQGLNEYSCREAAKIICNLTGAVAIEITKAKRVLAEIGSPADHYVTIPLKVKENVAGTLKLFYKNLGQTDKELAEGLGKLFSTQLELAEAERQGKLLKDVEIRALQAQINPHFLFNSINAISSLCRTDAEKARMLLLKLATYFRSNLQGARQMFITVERELAHIDAYMAIQQARLPGKFSITHSIGDGLEHALIPPFTLQMLVENACCHAFNGSRAVGMVRVEIVKYESDIKVCVEDNGIGIPQEKLEMLGRKEMVSNEGTGSALFIINQRLKGLYGKSAALSIESAENKGTIVSFTVPLLYDDSVEG